MIGNKGQGGLFVWVMIIMSIFAFSTLWIILDNTIKNDLPGFAEQMNATTATTLMNETIIPIWNLSPWAFAIALFIYGIFRPILYTPEGGYGQ